MRQKFTSRRARRLIRELDSIVAVSTEIETVALEVPSLEGPGQVPELTPISFLYSPLTGGFAVELSQSETSENIFYLIVRTYSCRRTRPIRTILETNA